MCTEIYCEKCVSYYFDIAFSERSVVNCKFWLMVLDFRQRDFNNPLSLKKIMFTISCMFKRDPTIAYINGKVLKRIIFRLR